MENKYNCFTEVFLNIQCIPETMNQKQTFVESNSKVDYPEILIYYYRVNAFIIKLQHHCFDLIIILYFLYVCISVFVNYTIFLFVIC